MASQAWRQRVLQVLLLAAPFAALAHHSTANFAAEFVELEGVITAVEWRNPHVEFTLQTRNAAGAAAAWRLIANSLYDLKRAGITREHLNVGATVKIAGHPSEIEQRVALATNMLRADGTEVVLRRDAQAYWSGEHIGGRDRWLIDESRTVAAQEENRGIFRVWSAAEIRAAAVHYPYNAAARAAQAAWNPLDNFMLRCEAPGMPQMMTAPHPHEFIEHGDEITLRVGWFDQVRSIHMSPAVGSAPPPSRLGYSVGHWEDNALVVETTGVDWPYADGIGAPQSAAVRITERFTLRADQRVLNYRATIVNPARLHGTCHLRDVVARTRGSVGAI